MTESLPRTVQVDKTVDVPFENASTFRNDILFYARENIDQSHRRIELDLRKVQSLPPEHLEALEVVARVLQALDKVLLVRACEEISPALKSIQVVHKVVQTSRGVVPPFILWKAGLIATSRDEESLVECFPDDFQRLLGCPQDALILDISCLKTISSYFCKLIAISLLSAREKNKEVLLKIDETLSTDFQQQSAGAMISIQTVTPSGTIEDSSFSRMATNRQAIDRHRAKQLLQNHGNDQISGKALGIDPKVKTLDGVYRSQLKPKEAEPEPSTEPPPFVEKRKAERFLMKDGEVIWSLRGQGQDNPGTLLDLSKRGTAFIAPRSCSLSDEVDVAIDSSDVSSPLRFSGRVSRCEKVQHNGQDQFVIGVRFFQQSMTAVIALRKIERRRNES